jgi:hypothetical protein
MHWELFARFLRIPLIIRKMAVSKLNATAILLLVMRILGY